MTKTIISARCVVEFLKVMSSPREEQDEDEQEDLSMLQAQAAENWTAWRSE